MSKGKLSNDYVISNILNFVNSDDDEDLDSNDEFHSDDLNELFDEPDLDLDGNSSGDSSAVINMTPKPDLPVTFLHTTDWSILLTNHLICLVTTVMTLGLLIP